MQDRFRLKTRKASTAMALFCLLPGSIAFAQGQQQEQYLNNILNKMDSPQSWQNAQKLAPSNYSNQSPRQFNNPYGYGAPVQAPASYNPAPAQADMFSPRNLLRVFMGGSANDGSSGGSSGQNGNKPMHLGDIQSNLQTARDQCQQAENDSARANQGTDKGQRLSAASSAQYHANSAREAAERAEGLAGSGTQQEKDYAAQARNAANRAQEAANRARYNAECGS